MFDRIKTSNLKALNNSFKGKVATAEIDTRSEPNKKRERQQKRIISHQSKQALRAENKGKSKTRQSNNGSTLIQLNDRIYHQLSIRKINTINTTLRYSFRLKTKT
jgi:hypothetical protein